MLKNTRGRSGAGAVQAKSLKLDGGRHLAAPPAFETSTSYSLCYVKFFSTRRSTADVIVDRTFESFPFSWKTGKRAEKYKHYVGISLRRFSLPHARTSVTTAILRRDKGGKKYEIYEVNACKSPRHGNAARTGGAGRAEPPRARPGNGRAFRQGSA
ncbi:hypothetical protein EVAR_2708_1 [Eumeta japonica]|uniref:Uncharacterized protein n=1 Tax=Eumeta variegata TaxID=151549 RepID=A0A4C1SMC4_EUMVA|nr:hypothetical protein EVAR_2708_1 [Eumeta japonica]